MNGHPVRACPHCYADAGDGFLWSAGECDDCAGLDEIAAKWGIAAAKTSADHASEVTTEKYLDRSREVDDLAGLAEEAGAETILNPAPTQLLLTGDDRQTLDIVLRQSMERLEGSYGPKWEDWMHEVAKSHYGRMKAMRERLGLQE